MRGFVSCMLTGILVVLALNVVAPPAGFGWSVAAGPVVEQPGLQTVDRTNKGDRIPTTSTISKQPQKARPVLVGCDPVFSPLSASAQANFAGRCVA